MFPDSLLPQLFLERRDHTPYGVRKTLAVHIVGQRTTGGTENDSGAEIIAGNVDMRVAV